MPKHITKILAYLRKHIVVVGILCGLVVTFGAGAAFAMAKTQSALGLDYIREGQPVGEPFRISLGQVVSRVDGITISPKVDGDWHFHGVGDGSQRASRVELQLNYGFDSAPLAALIGPVFDRIAASMVDAFVKRAEQVYG